jgi:hypothetical protein
LALPPLAHHFKLTKMALERKVEGLMAKALKKFPFGFPSSPGKLDFLRPGKTDARNFLD